MDWKPIETIPHNGKSVMVWVNDDAVVGPHCFSPVSVTDDGDWFDDASGDCIVPIKHATHWRPLPEPPVTEE